MSPERNDGIGFDREAVLPWVEVAHSTRAYADMLQQVGVPRTGSVFEHVDTAHSEELASEWCRGFLFAAIEHLLVWADRVAPLKFHSDSVVLTTFRPAQTLSRAALEAASQAVWVMDARDGKEMARRHLCLVLHDLDEQKKAAMTAEDRALILGKRNAILQELEPHISASEIGAFPGYMLTVKNAVAAVALKGSVDATLADPAVVERLWRASAGSAHGKRWPSIELQIQRLPAEGEVGQSGSERFPNPDAITQILSIANAVMSYGIARFADFSGHGRELDQMMARSMEKLIESVPLIDAGR